MLSGHRQSRWTSVLGRGLFGDGFLDRVRSASIGLFALSTAVGLALVALALNQTWHVLPSLPIPASPLERGAELDAGDAPSAPGPVRDVVGVEPARTAGSPPSTAPGGGQGGRSGPDRTPAQHVSAPVSVVARSGGEQPATEPGQGAPDGAPSPPAAQAPPPPIAAAPGASTQAGGPPGGSQKGLALGHSKGGGAQGGGGPPHSRAGSQAASQPLPSDEAENGRNVSFESPAAERHRGNDSGSSKGKAVHD